jgi:hypothetical protein
MRGTECSRLKICNGLTSDSVRNVFRTRANVYLFLGETIKSCRDNRATRYSCSTKRIRFMPPVLTNALDFRFIVLSKLLLLLNPNCNHTNLFFCIDSIKFTPEYYNTCVSTIVNARYSFIESNGSIPFHILRELIETFGLYHIDNDILQDPAKKLYAFQANHDSRTSANHYGSNQLDITGPPRDVLLYYDNLSTVCNFTAT